MILTDYKSNLQWKTCGKVAKLPGKIFANANSLAISNVAQKDNPNSDSPVHNL